MQHRRQPRSVRHKSVRPPGPWRSRRRGKILTAGGPAGPPAPPAPRPGPDDGGTQGPSTGPVPILQLPPPRTPISLAQLPALPEIMLPPMSPASLRTGPTEVGPEQDYRPAPSGSAVRVSDALTVLPAQRDARRHHANAAQAQLAPPPHSPAAAGSAASAALPTPSSSAPGAQPLETPKTQPTSARGAQALRTPSSTRNAAIMAAGTSLSRVTGFARVLAVGWVLGQARLADAYNQANTIPNTVYDLLLGGVLSATLLPVLMQSLTWRPGRRDKETVPSIITFLTVFLIVATGIFWLLAPEIIHLFLSLASGPGVADERALATTWLRLFTPQLLFIGLITITTALLNARRRFASVAFSPALANLVTIGALVVAGQLVGENSLNAYKADRTAVLVVGLGTTAGYFVQLLAQLPALFRATSLCVRVGNLITLRFAP